MNILHDRWTKALIENGWKHDDLSAHWVKRTSTGTTWLSDVYLARLRGLE